MTDILDLMHAFSLPLKAAWFVWTVSGAGLLYWRRRRARARMMAVSAGPGADVYADAESFEQPASVASEAETDSAGASRQEVSSVDTPAPCATQDAAMPLFEPFEPRSANPPPATAEANDVDPPPVDISQYQIGLFESFATGEGRRSKRAEKRRRRSTRQQSGVSAA
jgi:hypothetical protein